MGKGKLFVLSGASGVGKSTVLFQAMEQRKDLRFSVSATTRPPRPGEVEAVNYYFVSKEQFLDMIEKDAFVYDSDVLDITEPLRESLLLAEPMQALCKEDCQGLCTVCGADLNDGDCGCDKVSVDPRLAALKQFIKN